MIIDPMLIYLGQVFEGLRELSIITVMLAFITEFIHWLVYFIVDDYEVRKWKYNKKLSIVMAIVLFIGSIGIVTIPEKNTYYGMIAATYLTTDNLGTLKQEGKEIIDYLFEKLDGKEEGDK